MLYLLTVDRDLEGIEYYRTHRFAPGSSSQEPTSAGDAGTVDTESLTQGVESLDIEGQE